MGINLRTCFSVLFAVLIFVQSALLSSTIGGRSTDTLKRKIGSSLDQTAFELADKLDHYMWSRASEIEVFSKLKVLREGADLKEKRMLLDQLKSNIPSFTWVGITDEKGNVTASTDGILTGKSIAERPVFQEAQEHAFVGDVHDAVLLSKLLPHPGNEPLQFVDISVPIVGSDGVFEGVLASHLSWEWASEVKESLNNTLQKEDKGQEVFVVSARDNTVLLGPKHMVGKQLKLKSISSAQKGKDGWMLEEWPDGEKYLTGYAYGNGYKDYPGLGWTVLVRESEASAFAPVNELERYILIFGALSAAVFAILGWFLAGIVAKPLHRISLAANQLLSGKRVEIPKYRGFKDVEILSSSLRDLLGNLTKTETELGHMANLAHHDKLTGLPNRIGLDFYISQITEQTDSKPAGASYAFLYLDLDGFKQVNDTLGHHAGDVLLQEVAGRLTEGLEEDVFVSRLGGDEFLVIVHDGSKGKAAAGHIVEMLQEPFMIEKQEVRIGCSVGVALWPADDPDLFKVIRLADQALYAAKREGKGRFFFYKKD